MRTDFFLVFEGRAESGLLRSILNSRPQVLFEAEWMMFDLLCEPDAEQRQADQVARFFDDDRDEKLIALGFANKLSDIREPEAIR